MRDQEDGESLPALLAERRWRTLMDQSPFGIVIYRPDGSVKSGNDALRRLYELTEEEQALVAGNYNILEDPQLEARGVGALIRRAFQGEAVSIPAFPYEIETPIRKRLVSRWMEGVFYPVCDDGGSILEVVSIQYDVTDLKVAHQELEESRRRLHTVIDSADIVLWAVDKDGTFTLSEGKGLEALGLRPGDVVGHSVFDVYGDSPEIMDAHRRALAGEPVSFVVDLGKYAFDGRILPILGDEGEVRGATGAAFDITASRRADEERRRFEAKLQHAQKLESLGVLAGGIAHDFNNLLMGMLGNADLALLRLAPESPGVGYVKQIKAAAERASDLTNQMLAYSGKGRFVVEPIDLNRLVSEMAHLLDTVISKKVDLRLDLAEVLPAIEADAGQIHQIVMNMITNAAESIGEQGGAIRVVTRVVEMDDRALSEGVLGEGLEAGPYICLEVVDSGCGMDERTLGRIFDPFFTTKFTGRGLGLAAVMGIVRGHRASLRVRSRMGEGSTFAVYFPVSTAIPGTDDELAVAGPPDLAGVGVLVVDDEEGVREVTKSMLEAEGFQVFAARDGREGIDEFRRNPDAISLILLDMTMPHLDGEQAFRELKKIRPEVRIILTSGYSEQDATDRFAGKDLAGFLQKPFSLERLARAIRNALGTR